METIYFYNIGDQPYGCFSNFSHHAFYLDGHHWKTSEHYYQAQKFAHSNEHYDMVRYAPSARKAAEIGRCEQHPLRSDWEEVKEDAMRRALYAKFRAHPQLRDILVNSGNAQLVEETTTDFYWGCGTDGTGKNRLGFLLMELRDRLVNEQVIVQ